MGGLEGRIGLPALQPVPCLWVLVGGEGHGCLVYNKYTWSIGNCATWCNIPTPLSCLSLVAFKPSALLLGWGFCYIFQVILYLAHNKNMLNCDGDFAHLKLWRVCETFCQVVLIGVLYHKSGKSSFIY